MTTDLSQTIVPKSDQLNADDLIPGPRTFTVDRVVVSPGADQPVNIHLVELPGRPYRPSKGQRRVLVELWTKDSSVYVGRRMTLYRDPEVKWAGEAVGGIKISHLSHIAAEARLKVTVSRGNKGPQVVRPLVDEIAPRDRVDGAVQGFGRGGITLDQLEARVGRPRDQWTTQDLADLNALYQSLSSGAVTKDQAFPTDDAAAEEGSGQGVPSAGDGPPAAASQTPGAATPRDAGASAGSNEAPAPTGDEPQDPPEAGGAASDPAPSATSPAWGAADGFGQ
ncbi:hypothetical protein GCM10008944_01320 [Cytobacillus oceanisediminis]